MPKTIGIAAHNEARSIAKTIATLTQQLEEDDEIIVAAGGCTDGTEKVVRRLQDPRLKLVSNPKREGKAAAQNMIIARAQNEIIVFCDADVIVGPQAISYLTAPFADPAVAAVSAWETGIVRQTFFDKIQFVGYNGLHAQKLREQRQGRFWSLNGHLFALRRQTAPRLDPQNLVEDAWLGYKLKEGGCKLVYEPRARVFLKPAQNLKDYLRQKVRIRTGWWQMKELGMSLKQKRSVRYLAESLLFDPYTVPWLFLEAVSWWKAYRRFKKRELVWEEVDSGKI